MTANIKILVVNSKHRS